jgi:hypothetical protein
MVRTWPPGGTRGSFVVSASRVFTRGPHSWHRIGAHTPPGSGSVGFLIEI